MALDQSSGYFVVPDNEVWIGISIILNVIWDWFADYFFFFRSFHRKKEKIMEDTLSRILLYLCILKDNTLQIKIKGIEIMKPIYGEKLK